MSSQAICIAAQAIPSLQLGLIVVSLIAILGLLLGYGGGAAQKNWSTA